MERTMPKKRINLPDKYKYSYEQLLQLLYYSGELPFDLYKYLDITAINYQKQISNLVHKGMVRKVYGEQLGGYVLTVEGKAAIENNTQIPKHNLETNTRKREIQKRRRMQLYARLYALLDKEGIRYEQGEKSKIEHFEVSDERLEFYSAAEYKKLLKTQSASFKGTRVFGYMTGKENLYPVYMTNSRLPEFSNVEVNFIGKIRNDFFQGAGIRKAILLCKDLKAIGNILTDYYNFLNDEGIKFGKGQDIFASNCFDDMYVVPTSEYFTDYFYSIYEDREKTKLNLIREHNIKIKVSKSVYVEDGFFSSTEPVLMMFNVEINRYKKFVSFVKDKKMHGYLMCYNHLVPVMKSIHEKDDNITVIGF